MRPTQGPGECQKGAGGGGGVGAGGHQVAGKHRAPSGHSTARADFSGEAENADFYVKLPVFFMLLTIANIHINLYLHV